MQHYIPKPRPPVARKLTLAEAQERVRTLTGCTVEQARELLRQIFRDAAVRPYWNPMRWTRRNSIDGLMLPAFVPPGEHKHWLTVELDWDKSLVFDDFEVVDGFGATLPSEREWRTLWVDEADLVALLTPREQPAPEVPPEEKPPPEAPRKAPRPVKAERLLAATYPEGRPADRSYAELMWEIEKATGKTVSERALRNFILGKPATKTGKPAK